MGKKSRSNKALRLNSTSFASILKPLGHAQHQLNTCAAGQSSLKLVGLSIFMRTTGKVVVSWPQPSCLLRPPQRESKIGWLAPGFHCPTSRMSVKTASQPLFLRLASTIRLVANCLEKRAAKNEKAAAPHPSARQLPARCGPLSPVTPATVTNNRNNNVHKSQRQSAHQLAVCRSLRIRHSRNTANSSRFLAAAAGSPQRSCTSSGSDARSKSCPNGSSR